MLDLAPQLCVASQKNNVHARNYMLTVDLGGDDVYTSTAGGAPFAQDTDVFAAVSVVVDVGGNDRYEPKGFLGKPPTPENILLAPPPILVGSGSGLMGGV